MPFDHPGGVQEATEKAEKNSNFAKDGNDQFAHDLATTIRETFHGYNNRHSDDNRSAQVHMGPSEIGASCDRRIAMSLMGIPPVNYTGDGLAAWVGTQSHRGMAEIYEHANGNSGRFAVETRLNFPSKLVPKGTADLLDRKLRVIIDWKWMGYWSLKKLIESGPSETYQVQAHVYAYGAIVRGEKVDRVAIVGMPRQGSSLDEMFVWSAPYDKAIAEAALKRVEDINDRIRADMADGIDRADSLQALPIDSGSCKYCPHYLTKSSDLSHACNGRK